MSSDVAAALKAKTDGNTAFSAGDYQTALQHFSNAIEANPSDHVLFSNRSGAHAMLDNFDEALADAEQCIKLNSSWAKGYSRKGLALFKLGQIPEAMAAYRKGLEIDPNNKQLQEGLQQTQQQAFNPDMIRNILAAPLKERITQLIQSNPTIKRYCDGDSSFQTTLLEAALDQTSRGLGGFGGTTGFGGLGGGEVPHSDPRIEEALGQLFGATTEEAEAADERRAEAFATAKKKKEAEEKQKEDDARLASRPDNIKAADALKQEGNTLYKAKKFNEAIAKYDEAFASNPADLLILNNKAAVHVELGEYETCLAVCKEALEKRYEVRASFTSVSKIYNRMASCYTRQKDYANAKKMYEQSLLEDNDRHTRTALREVERLKEKADVDAYINPELAEQHKEKGNELYQSKNYPSAKSEYDEAIKRDPSNSKLYSNRAACYMNLLQYPSALKEIEKSLELDPNFVKAWSRKGHVHFQMKAYNQAQQAFSKGLQLDAENKECRQGLEMTLQKIVESQRSGKVDEQQMNQAMADPEVQAILSDPQFRLILDDISQNPSQLQEALKDEKIARGLQKLMAAGIVRMQ